MRTAWVLLCVALASIGSLRAVNFYVADNSGTVGSPGTFVSIVDGTTNTVLGYVDSNGFNLTHPVDLHYNSDNTKAYVTCDTAHAVFVIDVSLNQVVGAVNDVLNPFNAPASIDINLNVIPNIAYVTNEAGSTGNRGSVSIVDLSVDNVIGKVDDTLGPLNLPIGAGLSDDGTVLLVCNLNGHNVTVVDTATNAATGYVNDVVHPFVQPLLVAWSDSTKAYISDVNNSIGMGFVNVVIGGVVTGTVTTTGFPPFVQPTNVYEGPDGTMYITDLGNSQVYLVNPATNAVFAIFTGTFSGPLGVAVTSDNTTAYICNSTNNTVSIVDVATRMQTGVVNAVSFPFFTPYQIQLPFEAPPPPPPPATRPLRPICIHGKQKTDRFASQSELYNTIDWCASPSLSTIKYNIYRNGVLVKTINANDKLAFEDNNVSGTITYSVTAVSVIGTESAPVTVSVP